MPHRVRVAAVKPPSVAVREDSPARPAAAPRVAQIEFKLEDWINEVRYLGLDAEFLSLAFRLDNAVAQTTGIELLAVINQFLGFGRSRFVSQKRVVELLAKIEDCR